MVQKDCRMGAFQARLQNYIDAGQKLIFLTRLGKKPDYIFKEMLNINLRTLNTNVVDNMSLVSLDNVFATSYLLTGKRKEK